MKFNKVVAYYRKSTNPRGKSEEESVAYQQSRIREYAADHDLIIIKEFWDVGVTGMINNRPELIEMFHYLDQI